MDSKQQKFEEIYLRHYPKVKFFALSYLKEMKAAECVAQDVFVSLWNNWDKVQISDNIISYLMVSAKNNCLNIIRKNKYGQDYKEFSQKMTKESANYAALADSSSSTLYSNEIEILMLKALDEMPIKIKSTFILSRFKHHKYEDIAQIQNISIKTVEYRITNALKILRIYLKDYLGLLLGYLFTKLFY